MRRYIDFNSGWTFKKEGESTQAQAVELPHTWNAADGQDGGNDYYRGTCVYEKKFKKPQADGDERVLIEFEGVAMTAAVYVNGKLLCTHEGGYSAFRADITDELCEENIISVHADNSANDRVYPQMADFTFYGGIYRDVRLIAVSRSHFSLEHDGAGGVKITPVIKGDDAEVAVEAEITGNAGSVRVSVPGTGITESLEVKNGGAAGRFTITNVHKWHGRRDPYLYTLKAELICGGEVCDMVETRFGCRSFSFDSEKGFFLNGESYPLRGVSRHQDRRGVGNALTKEMQLEDMELIREIGANTIRLAHYQHSQYFYDLCDEYGMVVWTEIPYITKHMKNGRENTLSQMRELVTQCYNHPSIICWGLSNEITAAGAADEDLLENHRALNDLCHSLDSTRPTTLASVFLLEPENQINYIADIRSYNLYFGWYLGELSQNDEWFDEFHQKFPDKIIGFSEYGADANVRFQTPSPERSDYTEQYQALYHEHILDMIEARPYIWATHVWNMFDFAADGRDEGGERGVNQKGLVTFDRKIKKDAFYLYKARWSGERFVHICGRRYIDRAEEVTEIAVYSNCSSVALYLDGSLVEERQGRYKFVFEVKLSGEHRIRAVSGGCADEITVRRAEAANPEYLYAGEQTVNWFDKEQIDEAYYSVMDKLGDIKQNPQGAKLVAGILAQASSKRGDVAAGVNGNENLERLMNRMTLMSLLKQAGDAIPGEQVKEINLKLQTIRK